MEIFLTNFALKIRRNALVASCYLCNMFFLNLQVYPGSECVFSQDVAVVNLKEKQCCVIGQLGKERAIVIPDVDSMLDSMEAKTK